MQAPGLLLLGVSCTGGVDPSPLPATLHEGGWKGGGWLAAAEGEVGERGPHPTNVG